MFLTTHLPTYLAFCGQDPMLSAGALAVIGGVSAIDPRKAGTGEAPNPSWPPLVE